MNFFKKITALPERQKNFYFVIAVTAILLFMFLVALFSSKGAFGIPGDSGTVDEIAHIPSGYSYVKYLDYRLNPEHPPLAKALAGIPLALQKSITGPEGDWSWQGINQWEAGWYTLYEAGNIPAQVLLWSRLPMMLLMILLGFFIIKWATELFGRKIGLLSAVLFAFYPDVIAHGRLVTTDIAAALGFVITLYYFDKALQRKTRKAIIFAAIAFGIAQLLKFSAILLLPVLVILFVVRSILYRKNTMLRYELWNNFKVFFWTCLLSLIVVWVVYLPLVWKTPVDIEHVVIDRNLTLDASTQLPRSILHAMEGNPYTRALGHYLLGIMLVFARVAGGNATFALGHSSDKSISWFFPFAWLVKTPITIILLFTYSVVMMFVNKFYLKAREKFWTLLLFITPWVIYWALTLKGQLNIGIRHLMPTVPFVLLMILFAVHELLANKKRLAFKWTVLTILATYMAVSTLSNYPNFIAYFNEIVPRDQRYNYLVDSSLDWGQDLLRLKKYVDDNHIDSIKVDYFGGSVPSYYIPQSSEWHSSYGPTTGWLAVSATYYQSSKLYGEKEGKWSYGWLDSQKPQAIVGGSILVFHITEADLLRNPPSSPYKITHIDAPGSIDIRKVGL